MDDATLRAFLVADSPRDPRFVVAVMARIEQRRFRRELAKTAGLAAAAALLLALLVPTLEIIWADSFAPVVNNMIIAAVLLSLTLAASQILAARGD